MAQVNATVFYDVATGSVGFLNAGTGMSKTASVGWVLAPTINQI